MKKLTGIAIALAGASLTAAAIYAIKSYIESVKTLAESKASISSPVLTGVPMSVTPSSTSNAKMIATKEYVDTAANNFASISDIWAIIDRYAG